MTLLNFAALTLALYLGFELGAATYGQRYGAIRRALVMVVGVTLCVIIVMLSRPGESS